MTALPTRKLKYVAVAQSMKVSYEATERAYIGLENIESWTSRLTHLESIEPEGTVSLFEGGDVLFGKLRPYLAKVYLATSPGACSTEALVLRVRSLYWPAFLRYVLIEKQFIDEVNASTFGAKMPRASWDFIGSRQIPLPNLDSQKAIASFLDRETARIDQLIDKKEQQIGLLIERKTATIYQQIRQGVDRNIYLKETGNPWFPKVPSHWEPTRIRYLYRPVKRQGMAGLDVLSVYREYGVILKSSRDDNINKTPEDLSSYQFVEQNDLVINKMKAWQGSLGVSSLQGITSPDYLVYAPLRPLVGRFMHHYLRAQPMPAVYLTISNGIRTDQWRLEHEQFANIVVWLPPLAEQDRIAATVDAETARLDANVEGLSRSVNLLRERRAALITAAVTGQINVSDRAALVKTKSNRAMFRIIVGAEIVHRHQGNPKFGRVKLQKELYLAEAHIGISELEGNYLRYAAGPYDEALIQETEQGLEAAGFYRAEPANRDRRAILYCPLANEGRHTDELKTLLGPRLQELQNLIALLRDFDKDIVEAIATLYAVWNDALLDGDILDDTAIVRGFLTEWHRDKERFKDEELRHWLAWMRRNGLVPRGQGPRTTHTLTRDLFAS